MLSKNIQFPIPIVSNLPVFMLDTYYVHFDKKLPQKFSCLRVNSNSIVIIVNTIEL